MTLEIRINFFFIEGSCYPQFLFARDLGPVTKQLIHVGPSCPNNFTCPSGRRVGNPESYPLDSRYKLAGMTIYRGLERDPVFPLPRWEDQGVGDRLF